MLANLLPGIREIRAPLAAGYLWLAFLWLEWGIGLPHPDKATGVLAEIYRLGSSLNITAIGIAVSFAAYVIGILASNATSWMLSAARFNRFSRSGARIKFQIEDYAATIANAHEDADHEEIVGMLHDWVPLVPPRLLGREPDIYNAWDRINSEAEFRAGISFPLIFLGFPLMDVSPIFAGCLPVAGIALLASAIFHRQRADTILVEAITAERVPGMAPDEVYTAYITPVNMVLKRLRSQELEPPPDAPSPDSPPRTGDPG